ncbi:MAG: alpha/beta hydrolase [Haloarculaceae archaeon]
MTWETVTRVELPNGETIASRHRDGEVPLVLLHGNLSSSLFWDLVVGDLDERFEVWAPDLRGFGESTYEESFDSLSALAEDVEAFADEVGLDDVHLWGWSAGAGVAMQVAADQPDRVRKLVLMAPPSTQGLPVYRKDETRQPTDEVLTTREELAEDPVSVAPVLAAIDAGDVEAMKEIWEAAIFVNEIPDPERFDRYMQESLKERCLLDVDYALVHFNISPEHNGIEPGTGGVEAIEAPTLVLRGEDDLVVAPHLVDRVVDEIEDAEFVELTDCGHAPPVDDLDGLLAEVEPFLLDD